LLQITFAVKYKRALLDPIILLNTKSDAETLSSLNKRAWGLY